MESIIKHLVEITGHRDHDLLNISVASSLRELLNAESTRVLDVLSNGHQVLLKPSLAILADGVRLEADAKSVGEDLQEIPVLRDGILARKSVIEQHDAQGSLIWLPIWNENTLQTVLEIVNPANQNVNTMEVVNGMLVVYRNFQNLLDYSERDSLTGLLNRKTFDDSFSKILRNQFLAPPSTSSADSEEKHHWLAVIDIDHFKRVNDQFGHLYGDEVLILIANLMRASFRPRDRLFRFGGEEFVIILSSSTAAEAEHIFDRFREHVAQHPFPQVGTVTISIGYARIDQFEPAVAIVGRADQALYFAKNNGRNRSCYYQNLVDSGDLHHEQANDIAEFF
ncbi:MULTISPECIES: GGDEF domain-containing protein [unclassified Undibacterium]|uniref:GGDEF domain-containing protein n=1 Tax=unclassified Undibacterium TaxID=2630295 RepID=UPI002AC8B852|nr:MULTISPECIES: GGDEF domain-containing protein [unclassified Undibacterium]MEB0141182.1 GGDEF domain-containing protein [Undibacterium sp. CCC2.1]MEB0173469.1 GGDEF domain-containing protein [Undibacterium sp. CCC1.1]MEB0178163.1 GGDEF domain-containing protein [Undibacterium sp. CCC3.4]MEB0217366.1 GGDEF domain-containing protein [Undibacterium sp. 5I2]WPX44647.1 GGDEF domain-containing protein [Undibacterium sp. CCC3.4]